MSDLFIRAACMDRVEFNEETGTRAKVLIAEDRLWKVKRSLE